MVHQPQDEWDFPMQATSQANPTTELIEVHDQRKVGDRGLVIVDCGSWIVDR